MTSRLERERYCARLQGAGLVAKARKYFIKFVTYFSYVNSIKDDKENHEEYHQFRRKYRKYHRLFHSALEKGIDKWESAVGFRLKRERIERQYIHQNI